MSAPMKTHRTNAAIEVIFTVGKKRTLYLVPKEKAEGLETLLNDYRMDDFIPADQVFADLYAKYGRTGTAVRGFRIRDGLNQNALAKKLGCPQSWISGWEGGTRALGKKMAQKLAKIFGTDYRVFL